MKNFWKTTTGFCAATFLSPFLLGAKGDGIKEITKPYLGTYDCKRVVLGEEDWTERYALLRLEIAKNGKITLLLRERGKPMIRLNAKYVFDEESGTLTVFKDKKNERASGHYRLSEDGDLILTTRIGGKLLYIAFSKK